MEVVRLGFLGSNLDHRDVWRHVQFVDNQSVARDQLGNRGKVAFVINVAKNQWGGADDRVMETVRVTFKNFPELEGKLELPNSGKVEGM